MTRNEKFELITGLITLILIVAILTIDNKIGVVLLFVFSAVAFFVILLGVPATLVSISSELWGKYFLVWAIVVAIAVTAIGRWLIPISATANVLISAIGIISVPIVILLW